MSSEEQKKSGLLHWIEESLEWLIFNSRWILAVFYFVLVVALFCLAWKFVSEFLLEFLPEFQHRSNKQVTLLLINLVDTTLVANLFLIIIFNGYENFVSKIGVSLGNEDRPAWMGDVDFAGLKLKLLGTLVAISAINLLEAFLQMADSGEQIDSVRLAWMMGIHVAFVVTGLLFALSEKIGSHRAVGDGNTRQRPVLLVQDGLPITDEIKKAQVTENELQAAIRSSGCDAVSDVAYAILDVDGRINVTRLAA